MKRMFSLLVVVALMLAVMPAAAPVYAQTDAVMARIMEYGNALPKGYGLLSVDDLNAKIVEGKVLVLLDVREIEEYAAGHIEGSFNVPLRTLAQNLNLLPDLNAEIIVICKGGSRATMAMTALHLLGYMKAQTLKGGFDAWVGEEMPTATDPFTVEAGTAPEVNAELLAALDGILTNLPKNWDLVAPKDLTAELAEAAPILVDVRSDEEWSKGYIEGAQHIWIDTFVGRLSELPTDKNAKIVVYCGAGYRGAIAKIIMNLLGYTNVRNLSGGSGAWVKAGFPLVGVPVVALDLPATLSAYLKSLPESYNALRATDLAEELKGENKPFLVDVRTVDEYAEKHIEGAINIPLNELTKKLDLLPDLNANLVIYCGSGHRSAVAMTALGTLGYTKVRSLLSGLGAVPADMLPLTDVPIEANADKAPAIMPELLAAVDAFMSAIPAGYYTLKAADLNVLLAEKAPFLLDVRTDGEWGNGRIEGAVHIALADLFTKVGELPADKTVPIVIYDNPTHRSSMAMTFLRMLGYTDVRVLGGGVGAWEKAGFKLVK